MRIPANRLLYSLTFPCNRVEFRAGQVELTAKVRDKRDQLGGGLREHGRIIDRGYEDLPDRRYHRWARSEANRQSSSSHRRSCRCPLQGDVLEGKTAVISRSVVCSRLGFDWAHTRFV